MGFNSPSMRILINKICMALRGLLKPNIVLRVIKDKAATAVLSWNDRKFWILWKIDLPNIYLVRISTERKEL